MAGVGVEKVAPACRPLTALQVALHQRAPVQYPQTGLLAGDRQEIAHRRGMQPPDLAVTAGSEHSGVGLTWVEGPAQQLAILSATEQVAPVRGERQRTHLPAVAVIVDPKAGREDPDA